jgi:hypothetical protein
MAEMQDIVDEITEVDGSELEAVSEQIAKEQSAESTGQAPEKKPDDDIPEKYRGKTTKQLVEELEHANKSMGRYSNELGEVRRLADELIKSQLHPKPEEKQPEVDFFENPQEAIRRAVETNPRVVQAEQMALQMQRQQAQQALMQKHPDAKQLVADGEFQDWVKSSPIRTQLFRAADSYNVEAADELLSTFKQLKSIKAAQQQTQVSETEKESRKQAMQSAAVDTGGSGESTRKIYRRADLINLRLKNPAKFSAMQDEIDAAYREGRVK